MVMFLFWTRRDPKDLKILAQLIAAYSKVDAKKAEEASRQLPSPDDLVKGHAHFVTSRVIYRFVVMLAVFLLQVLMRLRLKPV